MTMTEEEICIFINSRIGYYLEAEQKCFDEIPKAQSVQEVLNAVLLAKEYEAVERELCMILRTIDTKPTVL